MLSIVLLAYNQGGNREIAQNESGCAVYLPLTFPQECKLVVFNPGNIQEGEGVTADNKTGGYTDTLPIRYNQVTQKFKHYFRIGRVEARFSPYYWIALGR